MAVAVFTESLQTTRGRTSGGTVTATKESLEAGSHHRDWQLLRHHRCGRPTTLLRQFGRGDAVGIICGRASAVVLVVNAVSHATTTLPPQLMSA